jgi:hypothetical protein
VRRHKPFIDINGVTIKIPSDLERESFGQFTLFQQMIESDNSLSMTIAIYLQPLLDGDYGEIDRIEEVAKEVEQMGFLEVFPVVNFFYMKQTKYLTSGRLRYQPFL